VFVQLRGTIPATLDGLTRLKEKELGLSGSQLTGLIPSLPFAQYPFCCLTSAHVAPGWHMNHFTCPLPPNASLCNGDGPTECK
jgi:hypothetical protein